VRSPKFVAVPRKSFAAQEMTAANDTLQDPARCSSPTITFTVRKKYRADMAPMAPKRAVVIARPMEGVCLYDNLLALEMLDPKMECICCKEITDHVKRRISGKSEIESAIGFRVVKRKCVEPVKNLDQGQTLEGAHLNIHDVLSCRTQESS
jgi:hypothetical protein